MTRTTTLRLGRLDQLAVSVASDQGATLMSLLADTVGGRPQGIPSRVRRVLRAAAPPGAQDVVRPLFAPAFSHVPDCLTLTHVLSGVPVGQRLRGSGAAGRYGCGAARTATRWSTC